MIKIQFVYLNILPHDFVHLMFIEKKGYFFVLFSATILLGSFIPIHAAQSDELQKIRNQAIYDAEWKFSQTIIKAKEQFTKVKTDPKADSKIISEALAIKNKAIADAQKVRDNSIDKAWKDFNTASNTKIKEKTIKTEKQEFCFLWWCW